MHDLQIDQMEHEDWVDKIPKLGFCAFFNSYVYIDWEKAIFFILKLCERIFPGGFLYVGNLAVTG